MVFEKSIFSPAAGGKFSVMTSELLDSMSRLWQSVCTFWYTEESGTLIIELSLLWYWEKNIIFVNDTFGSPLRLWLTTRMAHLSSCNCTTPSVTRNQRSIANTLIFISLCAPSLPSRGALPRTGSPPQKWSPSPVHSIFGPISSQTNFGRSRWPTKKVCKSIHWV